MKINNTEIEIIQADITTLNVDAIVNAANKKLLGGGGVDGAIHHAAGPALIKECITLNGCYTGEAKATKGYQLPASFIIHTVGPVWNGGKYNETQLLTNCYLNTLKLANQLKIKSIAFPNISTGIYRFPKKEAAQIALETTILYIKENTTSLEKIIFTCFDTENFAIYTELKNQLL